MNQILQSDWFWEQAELSDLARGQLNGSDAVAAPFSLTTCFFFKQLDVFT